MGAVFLSTIIFLPLFMVNVVGVSATRAGLSLIPLSLGAVVGSIFSGQVASRLGRYKGLMTVGAVLLLIAVYLLSTMTADVPYWRVTLYMILVGIGVGPGLPLYTLAIQNAIDARKVGQATSAAQFFRQIGGAVGAAAMGTVLATTLSGAFSGLGGSAALVGVDPAAFGGSELSATGGADVETSVRAAFGAEADALVAALSDPDPRALERALAASPIPAAGHGPILGEAASARGDPAATAALGALLRTRVLEQAETVAATLAREVREGFAAAVGAVFEALVWVVVLGLIATLLVPSLELQGRQATPDAPLPEANVEPAT